MKDKIIMFIIGVLVGAVISTGVFYVYTTANKCDCSNQNVSTNAGQPPEMPSGQNGENGQPPEKPNGNNSQPPEMPNNNVQENN